MIPTEHSTMHKYLLIEHQGIDTQHLHTFIKKFSFHFLLFAIIRSFFLALSFTHSHYSLVFSIVMYVITRSRPFHFNKRRSLFQHNMCTHLQILKSKYRGRFCTCACAAFLVSTMNESSSYTIFVYMNFEHTPARLHISAKRKCEKHQTNLVFYPLFIQTLPLHTKFHAKSNN